MIYLDHNSTTACRFFDDNMIRDLTNKPLNPSSIHSFGRFAKGILENARRSICESLKVDLRKHSLIFTGSGTEANSMVVKSFQDGNIFALATEHSSILSNPNVKTISVNSSGVINIDHLVELLKNSDSSKKTLVCVMCANNETGVLQPLESVRQVVKAHNATFHSDCVQGLGKIHLNFDEIGADSISISAHKCGGLPGIGALVYNNSAHIVPQILGGGQERGMRGGTENVLHSHIFAKAVNFSNARNNIDIYLKHTGVLRDYMEQTIRSASCDAIFASDKVSRLANTSTIIMPGVSAEIQLMRFDIAGFAVSSGSACSSGKIGKSHVLFAMGFPQDQVNSAIRVSLGMDNSMHDVESFIHAWIGIYRDFR
jgi:cysteine desulfurase